MVVKTEWRLRRIDNEGLTKLVGVLEDTSLMSNGSFVNGQGRVRYLMSGGEAVVLSNSDDGTMIELRKRHGSTTPGYFDYVIKTFDGEKQGGSTLSDDPVSYFSAQLEKK